VKIYKRGWMCISAKPNKPSQENNKRSHKVGSDRCEPNGARIVAGKRAHVPRHRASHLADRRIYLCGLTANIVCVILDQAVDLPRWHPNFPARGAYLSVTVYDI